jgi:hypothetical protein
MKDNFNLRTFLIENKLTANSRQIVNEDFISKIRSAVQGPEVDAIFAAAQEEIDNGDAEGMADALAIAADQYYEYYDSKGNEDGTEVAKYIMRSLTQSKSNVQDFSKLKDGDYKNWTVDEKMTKEEVDYSIELLVPEVAFDVESGEMSDSPYEFATEDEIESGEADVTTYTDGDELDEYVFSRSYEQALHFAKEYPHLIKINTRQ